MSSASTSASSARDNVLRIGSHLLSEYSKSTPRSLQVIDLFLAFAVANGALLFLYLILNGSFPYNSFLSAFIAAVAFFVFTVNLRVQLSSPSSFAFISPERAYAEYVICNLILFFAVITFMG